MTVILADGGPLFVEVAPGRRIGFEFAVERNGNRTVGCIILPPVDADFGPAGRIGEACFSLAGRPGPDLGDCS
jgi:hypothetical protein